ncbi:MAG: PadR family transcriptional regulator [Planctomycetes bacterium]|nr:PadR family transcriptional regulator [Planctomycetota bacterium]
MDSELPTGWVTQLRKGTLELCLLNTVAKTARYGYEIVRLLSAIEGLVIQEGTVYPILARLKREGFLETELRESSEGPSRKYYSLTRDGKRRLRAMNRYWSDLTEKIAALVEAR